LAAAQGGAAAIANYSGGPGGAPPQQQPGAQQGGYVSEPKYVTRGLGKLSLIDDLHSLANLSNIKLTRAPVE
jgi:hypothetical protein